MNSLYSFKIKKSLELLKFIFYQTFFTKILYNSFFINFDNLRRYFRKLQSINNVSVNVFTPAKFGMNFMPFGVYSTLHFYLWS